MNRKVLKIKQNIVLCLVSLSVLALSCNRTDIEEEYIGKSGFLVTLADGVSVEARSTPLQLENPLTTDFNLKIVRTSTDTPVYDGKYKEELIQAPAGFYNVSAWFGENPVLAVDTPYYLGTVTGVEVKKDTPAEVSVPCKVANALLSVVYDESIAKVYDSYYVTVSVGDESLEISGNQSAYFRAGSVVTVEFHGTLKEQSEERTYELQHEKLVSPFKAGDHAILRLSTEAGANISIEKMEVQTVTVVETIPVKYMPKPKFESTDFVNNELAFAETEKKSAVINLKLSSPLQDLKLKFTSADAKFASLNREEGYLLSNAEDKDIVEKALGITLPEIGTTEAVLDFSSLIPQLMTDAGNTVSSTIEVDAKANNRWSSDKETDLSARRFTLTCNKPEFKVSAYPGNIWTKEFTMNPLLAEDVISGDYETLSKKMRYQFSIDGETNWTDFGEDLRKADLTPGSTYYIRGVYRDEVEGEIVAVTTYPIIELENGNLSNYSIIRGEDGNRGNGHGAQYEWAGWATLNEMTTPNCPITSYSYNTRSGTRPISDVRPNSEDDTAVWIVTMGYGYGGTYKSPKNVTPSELFLGIYNTKGIEFKSHPTGVRFWYKYSPYLGDSSDICIQIFSGEQLIGSAALNEVNNVQSYTECLLNICYDSEYMSLSPDKISLVFKSGFNNEVESRESGGLMNSNSANPKFRGSELYIDDISLVYDK